jgi:hypothetical protein
MRLRLFVIFFTLLILQSCGDEAEPAIVIIGDDEIIKIPVVVHVLYASEEFNISDAKIESQIAVLNKDFRAKNEDLRLVPDEFKDRIADAGIEFHLATTDPEGKPTNGITRTETSLEGWDGYDPTNSKPITDLKLYFTTQGGHDAWPTDRYLNIWVVSISDRLGRVGMPGFAHFPGTDPRIDGVVIDPRVFGTAEPLAEGHKLGRTATHEIGHWLNLHHIFGREQNCESTDFVDDTPTASTRYLGNPSYPQFSCGQSSMFMNFMDYVNDDSMFMFTKGQRTRMRNVFLPDGGRYELYRNSKGS